MKRLLLVAIVTLFTVSGSAAWALPQEAIDLHYEYTLHVNFSNATLSVLDAHSGATIERFSVTLPRFMPKLPIYGKVQQIDDNAFWWPTKRMRNEDPSLKVQYAPDDPGNAMEGRKIIIDYFSAHANQWWRIHGEDDLEKIGKRRSSGCIRLYNPEWDTLADIIRGSPTKVVFTK
jgi:lipoprotein-anchoring transpeptidase ErfK/SrfK